MADHKDEMRALLVGRVDLVKAPANRKPLLLRKQDGSTQPLTVTSTSKEVVAMAKDEKTLLSRLAKALGLDTPDPAEVAKKAAEEGVDALTDAERSVLLAALTPDGEPTEPATEPATEPTSTEPAADEESPAEAVVKAVGDKITEALTPVTKQVTDLAGDMEKVAKAEDLSALAERVAAVEKTTQSSRAIKGQEDESGDSKGGFTGIFGGGK